MGGIKKKMIDDFWTTIYSLNPDENDELFEIMDEEFLTGGEEPLIE